jgi:hypothetical protein
MGNARIPSRVLQVSAVLLCLAGLAFNLLSFDSFIFFGLPLIGGVVVATINAWRDPQRTLADHITDVLRIYFGGHLLWSSLRYWGTDIELTIHHPIAGPFMDAITAMHIYPAVKALEGIVGAMLLVNRFVPLALVLEVPASVTIFYMNTFVTARLSGVLTGPPELGVNCLLMLAYFQYYKPMLSAKARAAPPALLSGQKRL